jgi:ADP-ribose pyrophosphatase YjhB (NUDIX family)
MLEEDIKYCPRCRGTLENKSHMGKSRRTCVDCRWIFFPDPKVAVSILVENAGSVLLVRRRYPPQKGLWTLPAGFVDAGEDPAEAAVRECFEETGLGVRVIQLLDVQSKQEHARGAHIIIFYHGEIIYGELKAGDDVDRAQFFPRNNLPDLAFKSTLQILKLDL